jgi:DNA-binding MarR family transcriptional regulator
VSEEDAAQIPRRIADEVPPRGILDDSGLFTYAAEAGLEVGVSMIPVFGPPITAAYEKARARKDERHQQQRDLFLYRLSLSVQDQVDRQGDRIESIEARLGRPTIQDLIGRGSDAAVGKSADEIAQLAEAVSKVITTKGGSERDAAALFDIVSNLREGDIGVLRALVAAVSPGDERQTSDVAALQGISDVVAHAALLRLEAADLVARFMDRSGEPGWTPTRLGVQIVAALGAVEIRRLPNGWTQLDADLLATLIEHDPTMPSLADLAAHLRRTVAELDGAAQVLEVAGYVKRRLTLGSQYASSLSLDDSAYWWGAKQNGELSKAVDALVEAVRALPDGQPAGSRDLALKLGLHPRLVQTVLRRLVAKGFLKEMGAARAGPLYVTPTESFRRADFSGRSASDSESSP